MAAIPRHNAPQTRGPALSVISTTSKGSKDVSSMNPNFRPQQTVNQMNEVVGIKKKVVSVESQSDTRLGGVYMQTKVGGIGDLPKQQLHRRQFAAKSGGSTRLVPIQIMDPTNAEAVSGEREWDPTAPNVNEMTKIRSKNRTELLRLFQRIGMLERAPQSKQRDQELRTLREQSKSFSRHLGEDPSVTLAPTVPPAPLPKKIDPTQWGEKSEFTEAEVRPEFTKAKSDIEAVIDNVAPLPNKRLEEEKGKEEEQEKEETEEEDSEEEERWGDYGKQEETEEEDSEDEEEGDSYMRPPSPPPSPPQSPTDFTSEGNNEKEKEAEKDAEEAALLEDTKKKEAEAIEAVAKEVQQQQQMDDADKDVVKNVEKINKEYDIANKMIDIEPSEKRKRADAEDKKEDVDVVNMKNKKQPVEEERPQKKERKTTAETGILIGMEEISPKVFNSITNELGWTEEQKNHSRLMERRERKALEGGEQKTIEGPKAIASDDGDYMTDVTFANNDVQKALENHAEEYNLKPIGEKYKMDNPKDVTRISTKISELRSRWEDLNTTFVHPELFTLMQHISPEIGKFTNDTNNEIGTKEYVKKMRIYARKLWNLAEKEQDNYPKREIDTMRVIYDVMIAISNTSTKKSRTSQLMLSEPKKRKATSQEERTTEPQKKKKKKRVLTGVVEKK